MFRSALALASLLVLAAPPALADEVEYTLTLKPTTLKVGAAGPVELVFTPKAPWHWNKDYPAKLELAAPGGLTVARPTLKQLDGDFKPEGDKVNAAFTVTASRAGTAQATVKGKVGLCDDKVCVIKKVELAVPIVAAP